MTNNTERNFSELRDGAWYQRRDGALVQVKARPSHIHQPFIAVGHGYCANGNYFYQTAGKQQESEADLILEIKPPVITPVKRKKKVPVWRWVFLIDRVEEVTDAHLTEDQAKSRKGERLVGRIQETIQEIEVEE